MPKRVFWPMAMLVMGGIFFFTEANIFPRYFSNLWAIVLVVAGLGGIFLSDRDDWVAEKRSTTVKPSTKKATPIKVAQKKKVAKKKR